MRINKFIANNSQYSRRKADELIEQGLVKINGKTITKLGLEIDPEKDKIEIDEIQIKEQYEKIYLLLNKPADYITSRNDELGRQTVMDLLPKIPNLKPAGRLDKNTEGLLIISNDGEFINRVTHPKFNCPKEYLATIEGILSDESKKKLEEGIKIDNGTTSPSKVKILETKPNETTLTIEIHEGKNRQIRKMFGAIDHPVKYLQRIRIADIKIQTLKIGKYRNLTKQEINAF